MKIRTTNKAGFTLVEIMIVVAIIGLLAAIAIPNFVRARTQSQTNACLNNLRQIDGAKQQFALETGQTTDHDCNSTEITPYLGRGSTGSAKFACPQDQAATPDIDSSYTIGTVGTAPTCQINGTDHILN